MIHYILCAICKIKLDLSLRFNRKKETEKKRNVLLQRKGEGQVKMSRF